jgi:hypothetical protein
VILQENHGVYFEATVSDTAVAGKSLLQQFYRVYTTLIVHACSAEQHLAGDSV